MLSCQSTMQSSSSASVSFSGLDFLIRVESGFEWIREAFDVQNDRDACKDPLVWVSLRLELGLKAWNDALASERCQVDRTHECAQIVLLELAKFLCTNLHYWNQRELFLGV